MCSKVQMNMNGLCELFVAMAEEEIYLSLSTRYLHVYYWPTQQVIWFNLPGRLRWSSEMLGVFGVAPEVICGLLSIDLVTSAS